MEIIKSFKDRSGSWPTTKQLQGLLVFHTNGEYEEVLDSTLVAKIVKAGNKDHRHTFRILPWEDADGKDVDNFGEFVATFRHRAGCDNCDYVAIVSRRALY